MRRALAPSLALTPSLALVLLCAASPVHAAPGEDSREETVAPAPAMVPPPPAPIEVDPRNYRMVLAGDIIIGLSGAGMVAMAVGLGIRSDALTQRQALTVADTPDPEAIAKQERRIGDGALIATVGGISAAALLTTGIVLVATGYKRERLRRANLPVVGLGPHGAYLGWSWHF